MVKSGLNIFAYIKSIIYKKRYIIFEFNGSFYRWAKCKHHRYCSSRGDDCMRMRIYYCGKNGTSKVDAQANDLSTSKADKNKTAAVSSGGSIDVSLETTPNPVRSGEETR